jgi:hypothetical protein
MIGRMFAGFIVLASILAASVTVVNVGAAPPSKVFVSNSDDAGPGSFRDAVDQANGNPAITRIQFLGGVSTIALQQTVLFTGAQGLTIDGNGATLDGTAAVGPAFLATGGDDLAVWNLTVRNARAEGIAVEIPGSANGTFHLSLFKVDIINNLGHGVLVTDRENPGTPDRDGSDASVDVSVVNSRFINNGYSVFDRDGLHVNEGGDGDLIITIKHSLARDNAADGIDASERGSGDVRVDMFGSHVIGNGGFGLPEDGFKIDEAGDGSIVGNVFLSSANNNFEEGFDFNENHAGDLRVDMQQVEANGNREEGIDYEEDDNFAGGGDIVTTMVHITANGNGAGDTDDPGLKIREQGVGNLDVTLNHVEVSNNLVGGIQIREDAGGNLVSSITKATSLGNGSHGINFDENGAGDLTAMVAHSNSSTNGGAGVRADQQLAGVGTLHLSEVTLVGNSLGPTTGSNVTVTVTP